ncbi:hypothetical protein Tco_0776244 [Tanacetum coccineum]
MLVPSSLSASKTSQEAHDWLIRSRNDTVDSKETHLDVEFTLKTSQKKHKASDTRNATLAIRVTKINLTVTRGHPMIAKNKGPRLEVKGSVCRGLDPSLQAYKYKTSLTHKESSSLI